MRRSTAERGIVTSPKPARRVGDHRFDDVAHEAAVGGAARRDGLAPVDREDQHVRRRLELLALVEVLGFLVAGEVDDPVVPGPGLLSDREEHGVAEAAPGEHDGRVFGQLRGRAGRAHGDDRLAGPEHRAEPGRAADLEGDHGEQALLRVDPGPRQRAGLDEKRRSAHAGRPGLEVLEAEELPGLEVADRSGRPHDDLDDRGRQAVDLDDLGRQVFADPPSERVPLRVRPDPVPLPVEHLDDCPVTVARRGHRLDDVAVVGGVVVAEEGDEPAAARVAGEEGGLVLGLRRFQAKAVARAHRAMGGEEAPLGVERERVRELLRVRDVRRRPGGHEATARGQLDGFARASAQEPHGLQLPVLVRDRLLRLEALDEGDALLEGLDDLLVVEAIGGGVLHRPAIRDRHAAPRSAEAGEIGEFSGRVRALPLLVDGEAVGEQPVEDVPFLGIEGRPHRVLALLGAEGLVSGECLLRLEGVVGQELRRRVDRGQAAPDDDGRQLHLQVGEGLFLEGAGQLERHQKVRGLPHAAHDVVLHRDDRRPAGAGRDRDVVEPGVEGLLGRQRAPEAHAPEDLETAAARERQVDQRQEVLVPAHRDAVLRHAAEAGERALVEWNGDFRPVAHGADAAAVLPVRSPGSGSIFRPSIPTTP